MIAPQDGRLRLDRQCLKQHRKRLGLSQEALAEYCFDQRLCVSIASIKRAESGRAVLYRTARHLAEIYGVEVKTLAADAEETIVATSGMDEVESSRMLIQLYTVAADNRALATWVEHFGGSLSEAGVALFGLPRAYRSDAQRGLLCATTLVEQGGAKSVYLQAGHWPTATPPSMKAERSGVWVERGVAVQLAERFVFDDEGGDWLRYCHFRGGAQEARFDLVGRRVELGQLRAILESTQAYQAGHLIYIRGVAGIGKTRLSAEFAEMATAYADHHQAEVLDFGTRADEGPLMQLARSLLRTSDEVVDETYLLARLSSLRLPVDHAMMLRPLLGLVQPEGAQRLYAAMTPQTRSQRLILVLRDILLARSIHRLQLLVVEDLHWADEALLGTLTGLLQETLEAPVIWLFTSRLEQDPLESRLRPQLPELPLTLIELPPLRPQEAEALVASVGTVHSEHAARCVSQAQGNPLFLTQLLLFHPHSSLPASLSNLVQTKLDQLTDLDRRAMCIAAVMGQRFSLALLQEVLGQSDYRPELPQRYSLVRPLEEGSYRFVHDLILQGIYEGIPKVQRDRLHLRLAGLYNDLEPGLRARHLHRARSLEAPSAFLQAVSVEMARYRYEQALELLSQCRAIDYAPKDEYQLVLLQGQVAVATGRIQLAREHFEASRTFAREESQRIAADLWLARVLNMLDALEAEETILDGLLPLAEALDDPLPLAETLYLKGSLYFPRGDFATSRYYHSQALLQARQAGDVRTEIQALSGLGDAHYAEGQMRSTHKLFDHCVTLCRTHGHADLEASNLFMLGTARIYANETGEALSDCFDAAELGKRVGNRRAEVVARLTAAWILISQGDPHQAGEQVSQALTVALGLGSGRFEAFLLESRARIELMTGRQAEARASIERAWQLVEQHKLKAFIGPWVLGTRALLEENSEARLAMLQEGEALLDAGCVGHNGYRFLITAAEVSLLDSRPSAAIHYAQRLSQLMAEEPCAWGEHHRALIKAHADWLESGDASALETLRACWLRGEAAGLLMTMPCLAASRR
ncbi:MULTISPECIES: ATP-binding protein [unclassified Halomonas]|uniref:ATP-binding protein n=1 Tax=unclassified Halomonas TaxID=2609666 RepID=UPI001CF0D9AC|nr:MULTISPECIES: AAA family ATPase [unclassified Halomonas]MCA8866834.1 AAA family ATPase [Halomonas sp. SBBP1]UZH10960.1 AAA family ATPase [Halomonas sp. BDJS001]